MSRPNNWPELLNAFVAERLNARFDWTAHNCGFFACDWLKIVADADPAAEFRALPSALAIIRAVKRAGGMDAIADAASAQYGWQVAPPSLLRRGDIAATSTPHGTALGVCIGGRAAFAGKDKLSFLPLARCARGWRIE